MVEVRRLAGRSVSNANRGTSRARKWGRGRLLIILAGAACLAITMFVGLGFAVHMAFSGVSDHRGAATEVAAGISGRIERARGNERRDEIAAESMLSVPAGAAFPNIDTGTDPRSNGSSQPIDIPAGTGITGPALVMTGFPRTPEGAIGQLAQIDTAVLGSMSPQTAQEVYASWALPGGVGAADWWITASVEAFLDSSQIGSITNAAASVTLEPAAALVKGTDGPDWVTVCVLMKVTATYRSQAQAAFGHCERMQWVGGRWMLAPGAPPAPAPATWPDTDLAIEAGWRTWSTDPSVGGPGDYDDETGQPGEQLPPGPGDELGAEERSALSGDVDGDVAGEPGGTP